MEKGDILRCSIGLFAYKPHYCVVVDINATKTKISVLPITSQVMPGEECLCYTCDLNCTKITLTREDTTKPFIKLSYLFLKIYEIKTNDCDCPADNVKYHKILKPLKSKLKHFNIYV